MRAFAKELKKSIICDLKAVFVLFTITSSLGQRWCPGITPNIIWQQCGHWIKMNLLVSVCQKCHRWMRLVIFSFFRCRLAFPPNFNKRPYTFWENARWLEKFYASLNLYQERFQHTLSIIMKMI